MAFDQSRFAPVSSHAADSPSVYSYITNDLLSTVLEPGYFEEKKNQLERGDFIQVETPLGYVLTQVTAFTDNVIVAQNAIIKLPDTNVRVNFASPSWESANGTFQFNENGSVYSNAPFAITELAQEYEVIVETQRGSFNIKQLMTVKDPQGITKQYYRAGSPPAFVVAGPWSIASGGTTSKDRVLTTNNTPTTIDTYVTENGRMYVVNFNINAIRTDATGSYSAAYFMLLQNALGVSVVGGLETLIRKTTDLPLTVTVNPSGDNVAIDVTGRIGQTWDWFINTITFEILE